MDHQVFISFSSKDIKLAEKIYGRLVKNEISCWISSKDIPAGADYQACIVEAISQATIVVLIFSTNANSSNEIAKELSLASKKILIPTRIEDVLPQGAFEYQLSNRQFIDLFDDFDSRLDELAERIKNALNPAVNINNKSKRKIYNWKRIRIQISIIGVLIVLSGIFYAFASEIFNLISIENKVTSIFSTNNSVIKPIETMNSNEDISRKVNKSPEINNASSSASIETGNLSLSTQPKTALEISERIKELSVTLRDMQRNDRAVALVKLYDSIPKNINLKEAEILLRNTMDYRAVAIATVVANLTSDLDGSEIAMLLGDLSRQNVVSALQAISVAGKIKKNLTSEESGKILANAQDYRAKSILLLANNMAVNLGGNDLSTILGDSSRQDRLSALEALSVAGKIKRNLGSEEASKVLANSQDYRSKSIAVLAEYMAENLGGNDLAAILGDTTRQDSLSALQALSVAEKIKKNITAEEVAKSLVNAQDYRSKSIIIMTPYIIGNLGGNELAIVLGETSRQDRLSAIEAISIAGRLKKKMTAEETNRALVNSQDYRSKAISILSANLDENLGGNELAVVLGDATRRDRLTALNAFINLGKVKKRLKQEETQLILQGMDDYTLEANKVLQPFLAR